MIGTLLDKILIPLLLASLLALGATGLVLKYYMNKSERLQEGYNILDTALQAKDLALSAATRSYEATLELLAKQEQEAARIRNEKLTLERTLNDLKKTDPDVAEWSRTKLPDGIKRLFADKDHHGDGVPKTVPAR